MFWCKRKFSLSIDLNEVETRDDEYISSSSLPWLWVGAELETGEIVTVTEYLNNEVRYGDRVNEDYLVDVTRIFNAKRWLYLDHQTLKEEEIPLSGLVIGNDPKLSKSS